MSNMTKEEKEQLVNRVADLSIRDVLQREDSIEIMEVCRKACDRRISEIEERIEPAGTVQ